jgi:hypothetical protein
MLRFALLTSVLLCCACASDSPATSDAAVRDLAGADAASAGLCGASICGASGAANRGCPGGSCNWCDCGPGWGNTTDVSCTQVGCAGSGAGTCQSQSDCPSGYACIFNVGCDQLVGQCNNQTFYCPHTQRTFTLCDCDGNTVTDTVNSCAPDRRYQHVGPCP